MEILLLNMNEGINWNIFLWLCCLLPNPLAIYNMKRITLGSSHGLTLLGIFPYAYHFSNYWSVQILLYLNNNVLIFKHLILSNRNIYQNLIPKNSMGPYVAKMFFLQSRKMKVSGLVSFNFALRLVAELRKI